MIHLLQQTYSDSTFFVFHKLQHTNPNKYKKEIIKQNTFLKNSRFISIVGITEEMMQFIEDELLYLDGAIVIFRSKKTAISGRWILMTTKDDFKQLVVEVKNILCTLTDVYVTGNLIDLHFPPIGIKFKRHIKKNKNYHNRKGKIVSSLLSGYSSSEKLISETSTITTCASNHMSSFHSYEALCTLNSKLTQQIE